MKIREKRLVQWFGPAHAAELIAAGRRLNELMVEVTLGDGDVLPWTVEPVRTSIDEPTAAELAANFVGAMTRWKDAGFPTVTREQYDVRSAICEPCEFWDGAARFGLGKCTAPGCGCTKFKRWLVTEECKHPAGSQWPAI
jgi:hypothetical protein